MPPKKPKKLSKISKKPKSKRKQSVASKLKKLGKAVKKDAKDVYKRAKNGRVYKLVNKRPRFVSKKEAEANGFSAAKLPRAKTVKTKARP